MIVYSESYITNSKPKQLSYLKAGLYRGEVKEYNVKTSDRPG